MEGSSPSVSKAGAGGVGSPGPGPFPGWRLRDPQRPGLGCGDGTVFHIYFPAQAGNEDREEDPDEGRPPEGNETILLAEDDEKVRRLSEFILTSAGYAVYAASDGQEALELFQDVGDGVDLALLDVVMPRMSGGTLRDERRKAGFRGPVVFASGYAADSLESSDPQDEKRIFLQKPFTRRELLTRVREALDEDLDGDLLRAAVEARRHVPSVYESL